MLLILFACFQLIENVVIPEDGYSYPVGARNLFELKKDEIPDENDPTVQTAKAWIAQVKQMIDRCISRRCKEIEQQRDLEHIMIFAICAESCYKETHIRQAIANLTQSAEFSTWALYIIQAGRQKYKAQDNFSRSLLKEYAMTKTTFYE
uniref:Uncharacterized protein n=1 Tax=Trichuris muris TaxID=70415 RepID=A0A5S6QMK9_TRIMR